MSTLGVRISSAVVSSKSSAERTISLSLSSRTPSSSMLSTMYLSSFSVTDGASPLLPAIFKAIILNRVKIHTSGVRSVISPLSNPAVLSERHRNVPLQDISAQSHRMSEQEKLLHPLQLPSLRHRKDSYTARSQLKNSSGLQHCCR